MIVTVEAVQREGQQRQGIAAKALVELGQQSVGDGRVEVAFAPGALQLVDGACDNAPVFALGDGGQAEGAVVQAGQFWGILQCLVAVGSDGDQREELRAVLPQQMSEERQEGPALRAARGLEQFFALVDWQDDCGDGRGLVIEGGQAVGLCQFGQELGQGLGCGFGSCMNDAPDIAQCLG